MPKAISKDSTVASVWPHLADQRGYLAGVNHRLRVCLDRHGNAFVRIGITGTGQKPCYRVFHRTDDGNEIIFGSYWDNHEPLENETALNSNWSSREMSYEQLHAFFIEKHGKKVS